MSSSASSEAGQAPSGKGVSDKKAAPTPKRSESANNLRRPLSAPQTRKEAYKQYRERERRRMQRERAGLSKGSTDPYTRPQDEGPVRALARDYVDSRRSISEFFLYFSLAIIVLLFLPIPELQLGATYVVWPLMIVTMITEGIFTARRVKAMIAKQYPNETKNVRGAGMYAVMRQLQIRKLRLPKPRVKPGDEFLSKHR
ncbi:DUF3043 domain-containing protein [Nocardiopsis ansamitocini]|uniref:DUF3043 domain-containing protein n=1 Tax=Nocardiopsis ansamitocini TaxID=1670832 RepID=A0A9W6P2T4_9ACTN|nr:DUF3043 domain-containing protein [Nocardiopsis ansamitocini]GLU46106.1 hypothetical protein Nans01_04570 [Nocardiopsis ansamitocini]